MIPNLTCIIYPTAIVKCIYISSHILSTWICIPVNIPMKVPMKSHVYGLNWRRNSCRSPRAPPRSKVVVTSSETIRNHNVTATIPSTGPEDVPCPKKYQQHQHHGLKKRNRGKNGGWRKVCIEARKIRYFYSKWSNRVYWVCSTSKSAVSTLHSSLWTTRGCRWNPSRWPRFGIRRPGIRTSRICSIAGFATL